MRRRLAPLLMLALGFTGANVPAAESDLKGTWTLVVLAYGHDQFAVLDVEDGSTATVLDAQERLFGDDPQVEQIKQDGQTLTFTIKGGSQLCQFTGTVPEDGAEEPIRGTIRLNDRVYPAHLRRSESKEVAPLTTGPIVLETLKAQRLTDPKERFEALEDLLDRDPELPPSTLLSTQLLRAASESNVPEEETRKLVERLRTAAEPYGAAWVAETRATVLKALADGEAYPALTLELARKAEESITPETPLETQAALVGLLVRAATAAGEEELARKAGERAASLEAELDKAYKAKVPPFQPEPYAGRKEAGTDRVVLLELFTGAQCPPCVAADVAFDALHQTYEPTELVTLQYHLHIPGPDPLTNPAAETRAKYYGVNSTPSTLFNGNSEGRGGGGMGAAEAKYGEYRGLIEKRLDARKRASIDLEARRDGDTITLNASARSLNENDAEAKEADADADADAKGDAAKPRLRFVLVEESIRFVGGNNLRFHHQVVRAMPGGPEGFAFEGDSCTQELTVDLASVRRDIEEYLSEYARTRAFPQAPPPVELKGLSVVAFVQDDATREVWHAVVAPVDEPPAP